MTTLCSRATAEGVIFALAEVLGAEEFRQAVDVGTGGRGFAAAGYGLGEIRLGVGVTGHLDESDAGQFGAHGGKP